MSSKNVIVVSFIVVVLMAMVGGGYYFTRNFVIIPKVQMDTPQILDVPLIGVEVNNTVSKSVDSNKSSNTNSLISESNKTAVSVSTQEVNVSTESSPTIVEMPKPKPFEHTPEAPVNGKLKAVIELGSEGFNYFVVSIDKNKNWSKVDYQWGLSLLYEESVDPKIILKRIQDSIAQIRKQNKVEGVHFLISSGALDLVVSQEIVKVVESRYTVEKITSDKEGKLAFYSSVPKEYRHNSFSVDIGSNNTKITWLDENDKLVTKTTYGAKYYKHKLTNQEAYDSVKSFASMIPQNRKEHCFIIGGVPFGLAKNTKKDKDERYTTLLYPQDYLTNADFYGIKLEGKTETGLNIYQAIYDGTQTPQFVFDWNANFTVGYLLQLEY